MIGLNSRDALYRPRTANVKIILNAFLEKFKLNIATKWRLILIKYLV